MKKSIICGAALLALGIGSAQAGPCTVGADGKPKDAGAGPTVGNTGQAPRADSNSTEQHPPTSTIGRAAAGGPASSEDAQRQMQGQPTASQQAQGAQPVDQGC
ncbi:hypothetical protein [Rhodopseudomonas palustris]|uniref:Exopolysaccharide production protein YjbE n=1 Tax=Rhodopseudomonas palustris (strain BisB18) TaxID=316056 RepID=Q20Z16_RHOPB